MSEILIVDDMASNRYILRSLLEEAGYRVREATDGLQAVDAATEFPPDLVLMKSTGRHHWPGNCLMRRHAS